MTRAGTANPFAPLLVSYTWNPTSGSNSWTLTTNWTPNGLPGAGDSVSFSLGGTPTVTNVPIGITMSQISVAGGTQVTFQAGSAGTLTLNGGINCLDIAAGASLNIDTANALTINISSANSSTARVLGSMTFSGGLHRLTADSASGITFKINSTFTQGTGVTGNVFGSTGAQNTIIFESGSTFDQKAGSNPFGLTEPNSKVVFQTGSLYRITASGTSPGFSGRTYANFQYNPGGANSETALGGSALLMADLTVTTGTFNFNMTGTPGHAIKGNISVASGATLTFSPGAAGTINLNGTGNQLISGAGTLTINSTATISVANSTGVELQRNVATSGPFNVVSGGFLNCGTNVLSGTGTFNLQPGGTLGIGSAAGISSIPSTGNIQNLNKIYNSAANYTYNGTAAQVTGNGLPTTLTGALTISNSSGVTLSQSTTLSGASSVASGATLNTGAFTLTVNNTLANSGTFNVSNGGTLKGTGTVTGPTTVASGGTVAPGVSPGILNTGNISFTSGSVFNPEINGTTVGTQYDQLNVTGTVGLGGATLTVTLGFTPAAGNTFTIINNDDTDAVTGTFAGLPQAGTLTVGATTFQISYTGGDGNDVVLTVQSPPKYRSKQNGNWNDFNTWQVDPGTGFVNAVSGQTPTSADDTITIQSGHTVTVTASVSADQLTVNQNGTLAVNSTVTFTIPDGSGTDLTVNQNAGINGVLATAGTVVNNGQAQIDGITQINEGGAVTGNALVYGSFGGLTYAGTSAQTTTNIEFPASNGPKTLRIDNGGGVTLHAARTVAQFVYLTNGTFTIGSNLSVSDLCHIRRALGSFSGTPTFVNRVFVTYEGGGNISTGTEIPADAAALRDLVSTNPTPFTITMTSDITVNNVFLINGGTFVTGTNVLTMKGSVSAPSGYIIGNAKRPFTGAENFTFPVGTANGYSPLIADVTAGTGDLTVKATQGVQPNIPNPSKALSRFWTLTEGGTVTANLIFNYLDPTDIPGTATEADFVIQKYDGALTQPGGSVNAAANTATINGVTDFSDWTLAAVFTPPELSIADVSQAEGNSGTSTMSFTVTRSGDLSVTSTVNYSTTAGTATAGSCGTAGNDYQSASGMLTFAPSDDTETIAVTICGDTVAEPDETFTVTLATPSNATISDGDATGTITNDDAGSVTYTWTPNANQALACALFLPNSWICPANWDPVRPGAASANTTDILIFDGDITPAPTIVNVPTQTVAAMQFKDLINQAKFEATLGAATLTVNGDTGSDLSIALGSALRLQGSNPITIALTADGQEGLIAGNLFFEGAAHKLTGANPGQIVFQSTSIFTTTTGFSGHPFGSGMDGSVVFAGGSQSFFGAGDDPWGGASKNIVSFGLVPMSSQQFLASSAFDSNGRTYGNLTLTGGQTYSGSGSNPLIVAGNFVLESTSTLTLSGSAGGDMVVNGNWTDSNTSPTAFQGNGRIVKFQGGNATQTIFKAGGIGEVFSHLNILKTGGSVQLLEDIAINGHLLFDGLAGTAVDVLELNGQGVSLGGTISAVPNANSGFKGDTIGGSLFVGANASPLGNPIHFVSGGEFLNLFFVDRASGASVDTDLTIGHPTTAPNGNLTLTNGVLDMGSKTLTLNPNATISRTNGYVSGNLKKIFSATGAFTFTVGTGTGGAYSPVVADVQSGVGNSLTVKAVAGPHPNIAGTNKLQRYWTLSNSGAVTAHLTFHYLATDVVGTESNYKIFKYNGSFEQIEPDVLNTGSHFATKNNVSSFSDWTLAEAASVFGQVAFTAAPYSTSETEANHDVTITIARTDGSSGAISVDYLVADGTANTPTDYEVTQVNGSPSTAASGTLNWADGETANKTLTITVKGDTTYEANETVNLTLSNPTGGVVIGGTNPTTLTINNDDAPPATLVVNTTNDVDDGFCLPNHCSLREAINAANFSTDTSTINFNIPNTDPGFGSGVYTIQVTGTPLPEITRRVTIDGATQTTFGGDTNANGPEVVINGSLLTGTPTGLYASTGAASSVISNLVINGFAGAGLVVWGNNIQALNNYLGTNAAGTAAVANGTGIGVGSSAGNTNGYLISGNLISGNTTGLSTCDTLSSTFTGNKIGTDRTGVSNVGNASFGFVTACTNFRQHTISNNIFAFNGSDGFRDVPDYLNVSPFTGFHFENRLTQNSFFSNGGLAINLLPPPDGNVDGVTPNDNQDPDNGGNRLQNFPVLTSAKVTGTTYTVAGTLNTTPSSTSGYTIEFFKNSVCDGNTSGVSSGTNGEGQTYLGSVVTGNTNANGDVAFSFNSTTPFAVGDIITATATDVNGNTSEFSACFTAIAGTPGSLQFAAANTNNNETNSNHTVDIAVTRTGGSDGAVSVQYAVTDGTATTADSDYSISPSTGTLNWADGDTADKLITITVNGDTTYEANETVNLGLSNAQVASLGSPSSATLTITNDDAPPATLAVNTTADTDDSACLPLGSGNGCTLREAINAANFSTDTSTINFNIPNTDPGFGSGVYTIQVTGTPLPEITRRVTIDGATQTTFGGDTNANGPEVVINGSLLTGTPTGLYASTGAASSVISNLVINGFAGAGLVVWGNNIQALNNYLGTNATGTAAVANGTGIGVGSSAGPTSGYTISGNLISGNTTGLSSCDLFSGTFTNNKIGTDRTGVSDVGNATQGFVTACTSFTNVTISNNIIAFNGSDGFRDVPDYTNVPPFSHNHPKIRISQNSIFNNGGIGINLKEPPDGSADGVTANDNQDPDVGGNNLQNFPVLTSAVVSITSYEIKGTLNTTPSSSTGYTIEFFKNSVCDGNASGVSSGTNGEGQTYLGSVTTGTTDGSGNVAFTFNSPTAFAPGDIITATATDSANNTSEFSACFTATANTNPTIAATTGLTRQAGSPSANSQIATVNDTESGANGVTVTVNGGASATVNGVTVSNLVNTNGNVTADIVADCSATPPNASFTLTATDGGTLTATDTLTIAITANSPPTLTYNTPQSVTEGNSLTITPATGPADNGTISTIAVEPGGTTYPGSISVDNTTGVVTILNTGPVGSYTVTIRATDNCTGITDATFTLNVTAAVCAAPPANMVAWYPGDGNAHDIQGPTFENGTLQGGTTFATGKVNQGFSFDGINDYVETTDFFDLNNAGDEVTIEGWIKRNTTTDAGIVSKWINATENGWWFRISGNRFNWGTAVSGAYHQWSSNALFTDTANFHHVALVWKAGDPSSLKVYLDGVDLPGSFTAGDGTQVPPNTAQNVLIGTLAPGGEVMNGVIDELGLYNRALSQAEILAIYNASFAGKCRECTTPPTNMVSWLPFNETSGTTAEDIAGPNDGTVSGATFTAGKVGKALDFNGSSDNVVVPNSPSLSSTTNALTVDAWVYWRGHSVDIVDRIHGKRLGAGNVSHHLVIVNNILHFGVNIGVAGGDNAVDPNPFPTNRWVHVAGTYDGATVRLFRDGVEVASNNLTTGPIQFDSGALAIGWYDNTYPDHWNGLIDEFEIFNRALPQPEIAALANAGNAGKCHTSTVQFAAANTDDTETNAGSHSANVVVTRDGANDTAIDVDYTVSGGTATTTDGDYSIASATGTLHWDAGDSAPKNITITVNGDNKFEPDETVNLTLSNAVSTPAGTVALGTQTSATLTILNDDSQPTISINDVTAFEGDSGTTDFNFMVSLSNPSYLPITVTAQTADGTATTANSDYNGVGATVLTFSPGTIAQQFQVQVNGDTTYEHDEAFVVNLSLPSNATIADASGTGTITNDDAAPAISINDLTLTEGQNPPTTKSFTFTVTKSGTTAEQATVNYQTADDTGGTNPATSGADCSTPGVDYIASSGVVTFPASGPGSTSQTVTILVCRDNVFETNETFLVNLSGQVDATIADGQAVGTINNDDVPTSGFVVNTTADTVDDNLCLPIGSGNGCTLREAINAANASPSATAINFAIPAADPRHFYYKDDGVPNQVTHDVTHVIVTTAANDAALPADKDPDWPHGWWSILPTSALPALTQATTVDGYTQTDATVNTSATNTNAVLRIEVEGSSAGAAVTGLVVSNGSSIVRGLVINRFTDHGLQSSGAVTGNFIGTDVSGTVDLGNSGGGVLGGNNMTIGGNTPQLANLLSGNDGHGILFTNFNSSLVHGNYIGTKANGVSALGNSGNGIHLTGGSAVFNTIGGTSAGEANTIAFNGNDGVSLPDAGIGNVIRGNSIHSNGTTAAHLGIDLGPVDGLTANDAAPDSDAGSNGLQNFPVIQSAVVGPPHVIAGTLNSAPNQTFTIDVYANPTCDASGNGEGKTYLGSTTSTTDSNGLGGWRFVPAALSLSVQITATATSVTNNTSEFSQCFTPRAFAAGQLQFAQTAISDPETNAGSHTVTFTVQRVGGTDRAASVKYTINDGTATIADNDYSVISATGTLQWPNGNATDRTITITLNGDTKFEPDETVQIVLSDAVNASIAGPDTATLTITNEDTQPTISINDVTLSEGDAGTTAFNFTVGLSNQSYQTITVNAATADDTATTADSDYTGIGSTLITFNPGETSKPFQVLVNGDTKFELNDQFFVNLSGETNATISDAQGVGTITNNDTQPTISIDDVTLNEGNAGTTAFNFTVSLSNQSYQTITVNAATADDTATTAGSDYTGVGGTLITFNPGETSKPFQVLVNGDTTGELNETFSVLLSSPTNATISDSTGVGTILNDDESVAAGQLIISEFRLSGPGVNPTARANNEFIELYNATDQDLLVTTTDGSAGWAVATSSGVEVFHIPNGTTIPAREHFLGTNTNGYSLKDYGGTDAALGDATWTIDVADNTALAVFRTNNAANFNATNRLDSVGPNTEPPGSLYKEGVGYSPLAQADIDQNLEHTFFRQICVFQAGCPTPGRPRDTQDNAADFIFADTIGALTSAGQRLGSPGPENLSSPIKRDSPVSVPGVNLVFLDATVADASPPNRVRNTSSDVANASLFGTMTIRRRVVNQTGGTVTRLRFRIIDMTTHPSGSLADLRLRSSSDQTDIGVNDSATCSATGTPSASPPPTCTVTVKGLTLEQPPNVSAASGGGLNSTVVLPLPGGLPDGQSINVNFLLGVQKTGAFKFYLVIEALP